MRAATIGSFLASTFAGSVAFAGDVNRLSPEDFLSLVEGKTVHYTKDGEPYGIEHFFGNGRVTWQFPEARCEDGIYWASDDEICFRYGTPSCWSVFEGEEDTRTAVSRSGFSVIVDRIDDAPLKCDGNPIG